MSARAALGLAALAVALVPAGAPFAAPAKAVSYAGTITFRAAEPSGMTLRLDGNAATIALGPGHVTHAEARVTRSRGTLRFAVPGLPRPLVVALKAKGKKLSGTATQGGAHATVSLTRGRTSADAKLGYFSSPSAEVVRHTRRGFSTSPFSVDAATGAFGPASATGTTRLGVRQYEVRFPSAGTTLAGTLTVPPGDGPHPAAVYVSGSGPTLREEAHWLDVLFISRGIAVLAYDKRGVGQSGGIYPGDLASEQTISILSADAAAAARFLAAQPGIDRTRVGFYGLSQGGWIVPQATARADGVVSWALIESGPTVTQGESDAYATFVAGMPIAEAERRAHEQGANGYDPAPWIRKLTIPVLWLYAGQDRAQPTGTSMETLRALSAGHDFATVLFPDAPHPLFDEGGFPPDVFPAAADWLRRHGLA